MNPKTLLLATAMLIAGTSTALAQSPVNLLASDTPIVLTPKTTIKTIELPQPFGPTYTFAVWVKLNDNPIYSQSGFSSESPPTIVNLHAKDADQQSLIIRVSENKFYATELMDPAKAQFRQLPGMGGNTIKAEPGKWYLLTYSRTAVPPETDGRPGVGTGIFSVNGVIVARTMNRTPSDKMQCITLGRVANTRRLDGTLLQPRIYNAALTYDQIQFLYNNPPAEVKASK